MKGYLLSRAAVADLDMIWDYTFENSGQEQADRYIDDIRKASEALGIGARSGRPVDDIWPGIFKLAVNAHFLFIAGSRMAGQVSSVSCTSAWMWKHGFAIRL